VKKANSKLSVIKRGLNMLSFNKRKTLLNSFVQSQFSFAPLVWMLCGKVANKKINRVHYKFLQVLYEDNTSTFEQLLDKYNAFTVHQRNIQNLLIEMHKVKYNQGPALLNDIFKSANYEGPTLRRNKDFSRPNIKTQKYGEKSLENMGSIMWNLLPNNIKEIESLEEFKLRIKTWKPEKCPCYLCKYYFLEGVGLIEICDCPNC
jgi:hypothetical protein